MSRGSVYALAAITAALIGYIFFFERDTLSTAEVDARVGRMLSRFVRERIDHIEIERPGEETIELRRQRADARELGRWRMTEPRPGAADEDRVSTLLGALDWADSRREVGAPSEDERRQFGLDTPRTVHRFMMERETSTLSLGDDDPTGHGAYLLVEDAAGASVFVVGRDVAEALDHDADYYRSRRLFPGGVLTALRVTTDAMTLERDEERWSVVAEGVRSRALRGRAEELVNALNGLDAVRFDGDEALESPDRRIQLWRGERRTRVDQITGAEEPTFTLTLGEACEAAEGDEAPLVRATVAEDGGAPIHFCLGTAVLDILARGAAHYRDLRPVDVPFAEVLGVSGALSLLRDGERWALGEQPLEPAGVREWYEAFAGLQAEEMRPATDEELATLGFGAGGERVTFRRDGAEDEAIELAPASVGEVWLRRSRGDQPDGVVLRFAPALREALDPAALRLVARARDLLALDSVDSFRVLRGRLGESLARVDGTWRLTELGVEADEIRATAIAGNLSSLRALRWVAEATTPAHGFGELSLEVSGHRVHIGAPLPEIDGGAPRAYHARLDDEPAVFALPSSAVEPALTPLAAAGLVVTAAPYVQSVRITGERELEMALRGGSWAGPAGVIDPDVADRLVRAIASLRALRMVAYGRPPAGSGLARPRLRVEVERVPEASAPHRYAVLIGAPDGEGGVYARREDLDLTFLVSERSVQELLGE